MSELTSALWGKGCPETVWDGPYSMRCSLGGNGGTCSQHGPFAVRSIIRTERYHSIMNAIDDMVADLLYYDRKEDENLPVGSIEKAIKCGEITISEIVNKFQNALRNGIV